MPRKSKTDESIIELLAQPSSLVTQTKIRSKRSGKKLPKPIKPPTIKTLQLTYLRQLRKLTNLLISLTNELVMPQIGPIADQAARLRPVNDSVKFDDYVDEIEDVVSTLRVQYFRQVPKSRELSIAQTQSNLVNNQSKRYFSRLSTQLVGINIAQSEPWLSGEVNAFVKENIGLIESISEEHFTRVERTITEGVRRGKLTRDIQNEVRDKYRVTKNKAALVARDQTAKFYGDLNRLRQTNNGIKEYIWSTSDDERVRDSHMVLDGEKIKWKNPPEVGHPGEDYQCRCVAIPVIE